MKGGSNMASVRTTVSVYVAAYQSLQQVSDDAHSGAAGPTTWPRILMSQKLEQLRAAYELLPPSLRHRTWILTSLERAA
jgi:hypothetical protein